MKPLGVHASFTRCLRTSRRLWGVRARLPSPPPRACDIILRATRHSLILSAILHGLPGQPMSGHRQALHPTCPLKASSLLEIGSLCLVGHSIAVALKKAPPLTWLRAREQVADDFAPVEQGRDKLARQLASHARWESCSISGEPLRDPIMACYLGRLYNREAILEALLDRDELARAQLDDATRWKCQNWRQSGEFSHIHSLKDVFVVRPTFQDVAAASGSRDGKDMPPATSQDTRLATNQGSTSVASSGSSGVDAADTAVLATGRGTSCAEASSVSGSRGSKGPAGTKGATPAVGQQIICPVSGVVAGGAYGFSALASCGHLFSDRALRAVTDGACMTCGTRYASTAAPSDVIPINGTSEQVDQLRALLGDRKAALRRNKKRKATDKENPGKMLAPPVDPNTYSSN
eukprot:jgi/Mesvir1/3429/Mv11927-RA.1